MRREIGSPRPVARSRTRARSRRRAALRDEPAPEATAARHLREFIVGDPPLTAGGRSVRVYLYVVEEDRDLPSLLAEVLTALRREPSISVGEAGAASPGFPLPSGCLDELTGRELDVLDLVARGHDNGTIAALLGLSPRTVRNHLNSVFSKLNIDYRPQAVVLARDAGLGQGEPRYLRVAG